MLHLLRGCRASLPASRAKRLAGVCYVSIRPGGTRGLMSSLQDSEMRRRTLTDDHSIFIVGSKLQWKAEVGCDPQSAE